MHGSTLNSSIKAGDKRASEKGQTASITPRLLLEDFDETNKHDGCKARELLRRQ